MARVLAYRDFIDGPRAILAPGQDRHWGGGCVQSAFIQDDGGLYFSFDGMDRFSGNYHWRFTVEGVDLPKSERVGCESEFEAEMLLAALFGEYK